MQDYRDQPNYPVQRKIILVDMDTLVELTSGT